MLNIIVAVAQNNVIGMNGKMPWHLPAELQYFKRITMGHPIIMGRKTFDSIGRVLPGRRNIVVTRNQDWRHDGVDVVHSIADAMALVGHADAFVIGGATLYEEALNHADQIYLTAIDAEVAGDTFFPAINRDVWQEISSEHRAADEKNNHPVDFVVLARR
jgi:dihydrofolate reductase